MSSIWKRPWAYIVIVLVLAGVFYWYSATANNAVGPGRYDEFAKYLTAQGVKMYGTEWCSHCKNQKKLFGSSFQYINYIDCDRKRAECSAAGIRGYPTWSINSQSYPGEQSLWRLAQLSGYEGEL